MDTAADRAAVAAAANTAAGVSCSVKAKQITRPGDAMVRLAGLVRDSSGFGFIATWEVYVAVSQDLTAAQVWLDSHADDLVEALEVELVVTTVQPVELVLDTGRVPAVLFAGTRAV